MIAAGGALGGFFVAVLAPMLFTDYYELHWGLLLCGFLFILLRAGVAEGRGSRPEGQATSPTSSIPDPASSSTSPALPGDLPTQPLTRSPDLRRRLNWGMCGFLAVCWMVLAVFLWRQARDARIGAVSRVRNFYGVLTVFEQRKAEPQDHHFLLQHGRITHGLQFADKEMAKWATSYYGQESGIGLGINALPSGARRIGVVGLGTGSITVYGRPGDTFRIYEINPQVTALATTRFTYLRDCRAKIEIVPGDARLSMEREPPQNLDLLVLDAFSGDAIPVHLLTEEAFQQYNRHLKPSGIIAIHISNRYLDLEPVVVNAANHFHYNLAPIDFEEDEDEWWLYGCTWILLSRDDKIFRSEPIRTAVYNAKTDPRVPLWTDDFASLFSILK
jgi:spermidine synthase